MTADRSKILILLLLVVTAVSIPAGATDTAVSDSNSTEVGAGDRVADSAGSETVAVVITLQNHTARETVSFTGNVTVTGGRDVAFMPVLFARTTAATVSEIRANPNVATVRIDRQVRGPRPAVGGDTDGARTAATGQTTSWGVRTIGADRVSDRLRESAARDVTVAVVDSGVDYTHPDLDGAVTWGVNFTGTEPQYGREAAADNNGHGTAVAGIIAAEDNERGTVGVTPGARLYSIKVLDSTNTGSISSLIRGINAALEGPDGTIGTEDDADVIQVSVGTEVDSDQLAAATEAAGESAVVVSSVGNDGDGDPETAEVTFPASYDGVLGVAATDTSDETKTYSSEGSAVDVAAPGGPVTTLSPGGGTAAFSGTSAAAPHVSGMVTVLLAADDDEAVENRTTAELHSLVGSTARDIERPGPDRFSGDGLVEMDTAVAEVLPTAVERTSSKTMVTGEETVTITQTAYATDRRLSVADSFTPSMAGAEIQTVTVNGDPVTPAAASATAAGTSVSLRGLDIGDKVAVTYTVTLPATADAERYRIESESGAQLTLRMSSRTSVPVEYRAYDRDGDGEISLSELGLAAREYARGELSRSELSSVAAAYARGA